MTLFDPNGLFARAQSTCARSGPALTVYPTRAPWWASAILRAGRFVLQLAGLAAFFALGAACVLPYLKG